MESHKRKARRQRVDDEIGKISEEVTSLKKRKLEAEAAATGGLSERDRQDIEKKVSVPDLITGHNHLFFRTKSHSPSRAEGDVATTERAPRGGARELRGLRLLQLIAAGQRNCV